MSTLKDIALRCNCSIAAVSKALNGRPDISPLTAQRIREAASEMRYVPNTAARTLITTFSRIIGLLFYLRGTNIWEHEYHSRIAAGIQEVMEQQGYDITPVNIARKSVVGNYADYCKHRNYDGVLVLSLEHDASELTEFVLSNPVLPMVMVDASAPNHSAVISDNYTGMLELLRYIHSRRHRRIAFVHGEDTFITRARVKAFTEGCSALRLEVPKGYCRAAVYLDTEKTARAVSELLALEPRPTCILCPDDFAAIGAFNEIRRQGLSVPEDISLAGYDGIRLSQVMSPKLTTMQQDMHGIGRKAAEMLLETIKNPGMSPRHLYLGGTLMQGETVRDLNVS